MRQNNAYLKFIYHEDLFIIHEPAESAESDIDNQQELKSRSEQAAPNIVEETEPVTFFGHNGKGILILIHEPGSKMPKQDDLDFLMKIIESGLKYSKNDFALVNTAKFPTDQALNEIPHNFLISFGEAHRPFSDNIALYEVRDTADKKELFAENLSMIAANDSKKRQLWKALKTMFNL